MAKPRRVRWECPNGLHPAVLGSTRPLAEATVRFCLRCSEAEGKLVRRVAPALEAKRVARQRQSAAAAERQREREREARESALRVVVLGYGDGGETVEIDAGELLKLAWASRTLRDARADAGNGRMRVPSLTVRRGNPERGRAARSREHGRAERERDAMSGHSKAGSGAIVLTCAPGLGREWLEAIVVHEAVHSALPDGKWHGRSWRSTYIRAMRELYGVVVANEGQATWRLDEEIAHALRELGRAGC